MVQNPLNTKKLSKYTFRDLYGWKNITKMKIIISPNIHRLWLICWHGRCDYMLWYLSILLCFWSIFIQFLGPFMSELLYFHQTFADCVFNKYTHFDILICWYARCACKLWKALWLFFLGILSKHVLLQFFHVL